jgi:hypothetical protein
MIFGQDRNALVARNDILNAVFSAQGMSGLDQEARAIILNNCSVTVKASQSAKSNAKVYFVNNDVVIDYYLDHKLVNTQVIDDMDNVKAIEFAQAKLKAIASQK